jgi:hypothetical protein
MNGPVLYPMKILHGETHLMMEFQLKERASNFGNAMKKPQFHSKQQSTISQGSKEQRNS